MLERIAVAAVIISVVMVLASHKLTVLFQGFRQRRKETRDWKELTVSGCGWRLRRGLRRPPGAVVLSGGQVLKARRGIVLGRGRGCRIRLYPDCKIPREDYGQVSREHARIGYDKVKGEFFIEDMGSTNGIRWAPLGDGERREVFPRFVEGRMYIDKDVCLWIGPALMEVRLSQNRSVSPERTDTYIGTKISFALLQLAMLFLLTLSVAALPWNAWVPGALLVFFAYASVFKDGRKHPFIWTAALILLTAALFFVLLHAKGPDSVFKVCSAIVYLGLPIAALLQQNWEWTAKDILKFLVIYFLAVTLFLSGVINSYREVVMLAFLAYGGNELKQKALGRIP